MSEQDAAVHKPAPPAIKLFVAVVDRKDAKRVEDLLRERHALFQYMVYGKGTANSEVLKALGLSGSEKAVCACADQTGRVNALLASAAERLDLNHPGHGIAFIIPLSGVSASIQNASLQQIQTIEQHHKRWAENMETNEHEKQEIRFELVAAVVNQGYSEHVMDAAHKAGARGGTIVHARRTGTEEAEKFFGITLQEEKEMVFILIPHNQKTGLMQAISKTCGMKTEAKGIVVSLPVEDCAGISGEIIDK